MGMEEQNISGMTVSVNCIDDFRANLAKYLINKRKDEAPYDIKDIKEISKGFIDYIKSVDHFYLYRYCGVNDFLYSSLKQKSIYLCSNTQFDDIYEGIPADQLDLYKAETEVIFVDAKKQRKYTKIVNRENIIKNRPEYLYIKCFSENEKNMPMWGLYADKYRGVCLRYDVKKLNNDILEHLFPVIYTDERCAISGFDIEDLHGKDLCKNNILFPIGMYKGVDWKFESEWRLIYQANELRDESGHIEQNIELDCLDEIYLGFDMSEKDSLWIRMMADSLGIVVKQQKLMDSEFGCYYEEISDEIAGAIKRK